MSTGTKAREDIDQVREDIDQIREDLEPAREGRKESDEGRRDGAAPAEELSVEESFARLDEMVKALESENSTIEDSFRIYQDGMALLRKLGEKLDGYEKKMQQLTEDGVLEDF